MGLSRRVALVVLVCLLPGARAGGDEPEAIFDFFTFDAERKVGLIPTFLIEFGFVPSVGLYFFADDAFAQGNAIRAHAGFWGPSWIGFGLTDRYTFGSAAQLAVSGSFQRRPDLLFYGIGPDSRDDLRSRCADDRSQATDALTHLRPLAIAMQ